MTIRVLIADDHGIVRSGLRSELVSFDGLEVIGEAVNGDATLQLTFELQPDVLILDINMPGLKANQILSRLRRRDLKTRVLVFSASDDSLTIKEMLKAGVKGYVLKGDDPEDLVKAIRTIMNGKTWLSPTVADVVVETLVENNGESKPSLLSDRDIRILQLMSKGYQSEQIGEEMFIAKRTVNYHIEMIYKRLQVKNRAEAIAKAFQQGLIQP